MKAVNLISRYNHLNGKQISVATLRSFHQDVQRFLDSVGHGPFVSDLKGILSRISNALKQAAGYEVIDRVELTPIDIHKTNGRILRVASGYEEKRKAEKKVVIEKPANLVAEEIPISKIYTDTKRFQNRQDAFSEASANSVAENYDPNKFDPIVVWMDKKAKKLFVLSGHSRYEGMKRRKAKAIAVRYFKGTESEAVQFAKVEANRGATQETLIEDLAAYRLMRDGDAKRGVKKLNKSELQKIFKGKVQKLEAYSYLAPGGLFVNALSQSTTSNYPYLERNAQWIGQLRKQNAVLQNGSEDNIFHFFYSDKSGKHLKLSKDEFFKLAKKRINQLAKGEHILFPECSTDGCVRINEKESDPIKGATYKRLREVNETLESIHQKLKSTDPAVRVSTQAERDYLIKELGPKLNAEKERLQAELNMADKQESLFGISECDCYGLERDPEEAKGGEGLGFTKEGQQKAARAADFILDKKETTVVEPLKSARDSKSPRPPVERKERSQAIQERSKKPAAAMAGFSKKLQGVVSADQLAGLTFKEIPLDGEWKTEFNRLMSDTQVMIWGVPGSGKTVKLLKFAQYLAQKGMPTLYVANEEFGRSSFTEKIKEFGIGNPNLFFARDLPEDLSQFEVVFLDSVQSLGMDLDGYKVFRQTNPNKLTVAIIQSTKDGDFRGGKDWEHEVDIAGEVVSRKLLMRKNRLDPDHERKAERIQIEHLVKEKTKAQKIRETVRQKIEPQPKKAV